MDEAVTDYTEEISGEQPQSEEQPQPQPQTSEQPQSYTDAKTRLDEIVKQVRGKDVSLERSLDLLEEGVKLANQCTELIDQTRWDEDLPDEDESEAEGEGEGAEAPQDAAAEAEPEPEPESEPDAASEEPEDGAETTPDEDSEAAREE